MGSALDIGHFVFFQKLKIFKASCQKRANEFADKMSQVKG